MYSIPLNYYIRFAKYPNIYTEGIEFPDTTGRWIVAKKAKISFDIPHTESDIAIKLRGCPYLRYKQYKIRLKLYVNGHYMRSAKLFTHKNRGFLLTVPNKYFSESDHIDISFKASGVYRRNKLKIRGNDSRYLSLKLISMDIFEIDPEITPQEQIKLIEEQRRVEALEASAMLEPVKPKKFRMMKSPARTEQKKLRRKIKTC